jgi:hypothetical protein
VRLPADMVAGWREYRHRRHGWELELAGFALYLGYDWDEVTGDGDLRLAAEQAGARLQAAGYLSQSHSGSRSRRRSTAHLGARYFR